MNNPYSRIKADTPTECRDLHNIFFGDGSRVVPLDHWGAGCPFEGETGAIVTGESYTCDEKGEA